MLTVNKLIEEFTNMAKQGKGNYPVLLAGPNGVRLFPVERGDIGKIRADDELLDVLVLYPRTGAPTMPTNIIPLIGEKK